MEITDNIIIYEAHDFPHFLMQPFYSDYVGIVVCHQGMFRFCVDGTSFVASMGETVFLSPGILFHVQEVSADFRYTLLFSWRLFSHSWRNASMSLLLSVRKEFNLS